MGLKAGHGSADSSSSTTATLESLPTWNSFSRGVSECGGSEGFSRQTTTSEANALGNKDLGGLDANDAAQWAAALRLVTGLQ